MEIRRLVPPKPASSAKHTPVQDYYAGVTNAVEITQILVPFAARTLATVPVAPVINAYRVGVSSVELKSWFVNGLVSSNPLISAWIPDQMWMIRHGLLDAHWMLHPTGINAKVEWNT